MSDIVAKKIYKGKTKPIRRKNKRATLPEWKSREVFTSAIKSEGEQSSSTITHGHNEPKEFALPRLAPSLPERPPKRSPKPQSLYASSWRSLKSADIVAFNGGAEREFVMWLTNAIEGADYSGVSVGWVLQNGAFHLGVSMETIKRYLGKYTADLAPFHSDGAIVTLRNHE